MLNSYYLRSSSIHTSGYSELLCISYFWHSATLLTTDHSATLLTTYHGGTLCTTGHSATLRTSRSKVEPMQWTVIEL